MSTLPRPLAILFADVAGSTRLYETLGDNSALAAVDSVLRLVADAVIAQGGRVVKTIGDEIMAAFSTAEAACEAAMGMQRAVDALTAVNGPNGSSKLGIRIGFHFGPVIDDGKDCFGDTVNVAARMVGVAMEGQIITTGDALNVLSPMQQTATRDLVLRRFRH